MSSEWAWLRSKRWRVGLAASRPSGAGFTITWLIHDVAVWRVDQFATPTDGNPWILTKISFDPGHGSPYGARALSD
jgi:hypothetical protein